MKLVLSRKGFDANYGGRASPILPDGTLVPLPIPSEDDMNTMADINVPGVDIGQLIFDLSRERYGPQTLVHLDPDLDRSPGQRLAGWRPALGQTGIAQNHLQAQDVGVDDEDVFLFYGWFRQVDHARGAWRYCRGAPDLHVIFGWLEIGDVLPIVLERDRCLREHPWIEDHPHVRIPAHYNDPRNTLYVAANHSRYAPEPFGGGVDSLISLMGYN